VPEIHILGFDGDLRGRRILFRIRTRIRDERNFPSIMQLREQIQVDIERTGALSTNWRAEETELAPGASLDKVSG